MGHRVRAVMGKGDERPTNPEGVHDLLGLPPEEKRRFSRGIIADRNVGPPDPVTKTPSKRFYEGFFCRKAGREALGRPGPFLTRGDFFSGKDPLNEMVSPAVHHPFDPVDIHDINASAYNHLPTPIIGGKGSRALGFK